MRQMRIQGRLQHRWSPWFDGLTISYEGEDITVLRGSLVDEAALHGILIKVRDLALPLLSSLRGIGRHIRWPSVSCRYHPGRTSY